MILIESLIQLQKLEHLIEKDGRKMKVRKITILSLTTIALASTIVPSTVAVASEYENNNNTTQEYINHSTFTNLEKTLIDDGVSKEEWNKYINYVKVESSSGVSTYGLGSAAIKAAKSAIKFAVKHVDVIPSKTIRNLFKNYGSKIVTAVDTVETWTWYGIASALTKVGIPDSYADLIADFIVTFIL